MSKLNKEPEEVSRCLFDEALVENYNETKKTSEKTDDLVASENEEQNLTSKKDDNEKNILKITMLINKFNSDLDLKENGDEKKRHKKDINCTMFFNKEVTIKSDPDGLSPLIVKSLEPNETLNSNSKQSISAKFSPLKAVVPKLNSAKIDNSLEGRNCTQPDLRIHNSLTSISKSIKLGLKGVLKSKIPSMTIIETNSILKAGNQKAVCLEEGNKITDSPQEKVDKQSKSVNLLMSKSNNDNNRRSLMKFKKEEVGSVSDSKLLYTDLNRKKHIKKYDKKSRGDSSKEAHNSGGRKQVQWKTEVDVIYFSTHQAANGDKRGEVVKRVIEPLREEWEQQRKGFYAKIVSYHIENHLKDHFISLLKI